jgi:hypothetical protein
MLGRSVLLLLKWQHYWKTNEVIQKSHNIGQILVICKKNIFNRESLRKIYQLILGLDLYAESFYHDHG